MTDTACLPPGWLAAGGRGDDVLTALQGLTQLVQVCAAAAVHLEVPCSALHSRRRCCCCLQAARAWLTASALPGGVAFLSLPTPGTPTPHCPPACPACLPARPPALPACLPARLPARPPACLPAYLQDTSKLVVIVFCAWAILDFKHRLLAWVAAGILSDG